ncbi:XrtA/PEP-CTERM system TPR-repeat protein PrsT [Alteromonas halophila]|uniref:PEP-CTERM system TPR-repeat protein PrsT n=1 Tax=Alteromonas halophila TaxID=516698 RepID=A0A918MYX3_9ALTE|nr:XrtA/PEP-CTERM system TPR-repeat protein PrsT [Alteromonas halophila]GGW86883.1 hypothetical protein GCM10007391_20810 [Alteromonas halophila]
MKTLNAFALGVALSLSGCAQESGEDKLANAREQFRNGNYSTAAVTLKGLVAENPQRTTARILLGRSYLYLGDVALAEKELTNALNQQAELSEVVPPLLQAYLQQRKFAEILDLQKVEKNADDSLKSLLLAFSVYAHMALGEESAAHKFYEERAQVLDDYHHTKLALSYLLLAEGEFNKVIEVTDELLKKGLDIPEVHMVRSRAFSGQGEFGDAVTALEAYLDNYPNNSTAKLNLATALIKDEQIERAEEISDELLKRFPNQPVANQVKALARYERGDVEAANEHIELAISYGFDQPTNRILAGATSFRLQNFEQAYTHFRNAAAALPDNRDVHRLLALTQTVLGYHTDVAKTYNSIDDLSEADVSLITSNIFELARSGKRKDASDMLDMIESSGVSSPEILAKRGILKLSLDDESGMEELRQAIKENPKQTDARQAIILASLVAGNHEQVLAELDSYLKQVDKDEKAMLFAAGIYVQMNMLEKAGHLYNKTVELNSSSSDAYIGLSELAKKQGEPGEAFGYLEKALKNEPDNLPALLSMQMLSQNVTANERKRADDYFERAIVQQPDNVAMAIAYSLKLLEKEQPAEAVNILSKFRKQNSLPNSYWEVYSDALKLNGKDGESIRLLTEWANSEPENGQASYRLLIAYDAVRDFENARKVAKTAMRRAEPADLFRLYYSYYSIRLNNIREAKTEFVSIDEKYKDLPLAMGVKGVLSLADGNFETAINQLEAFHNYYDFSYSTEILAFAHKKAGNNAKAIEILRKYQQRVPGDQKIRSLLASMISKTEPEKAMEHYEILIDANPNNVFALNNLAGLYTRQGDYGKAITLTERALALLPDNADFQDTLGVALLKSGDTDKAIYFLKRAYSESDYSAEIYLNYAEALIENRNFDDARNVLARIKAEDKSSIVRYTTLMNKLDN